MHMENGECIKKRHRGKKDPKCPLWYLREAISFSLPFLSDLVLLIVMVQLTKDQRVWVCTGMARIDNAHQVKWPWADHWPGAPAPAVKNIAFHNALVPLMEHMFSSRCQAKIQQTS